MSSVQKTPSNQDPDGFFRERMQEPFPDSIRNPDEITPEEQAKDLFKFFQSRVQNDPSKKEVKTPPNN